MLLPLCLTDELGVCSFLWEVDWLAVGVAGVSTGSVFTSTLPPTFSPDLHPSQNTRSSWLPSAPGSLKSQLALSLSSPLPVAMVPSVVMATLSATVLLAVPIEPVAMVSSINPATTSLCSSLCVWNGASLALQNTQRLCSGLELPILGCEGVTV